MSGLTQEQVAALVGVLTTGVPQDEVVVQHQGTLQRPADTLALLASRFADGDEGEGIGPHSGLERGVSHASLIYNTYAAAEKRGVMQGCTSNKIK